MATSLAAPTRFIEASGGKVIGSVRHPLGTADFASFLLQAQSSRAKIVGLANAGSDTINSIKQAVEFGLARGGQRLAAIAAVITDVHAVGLADAQGLLLTSRFIGTAPRKAGNGQSASSPGAASCRPKCRPVSIRR